MTPEQALKRSAQQPVRETDPNVLQRRAAEPATSVWVGASAGTGKTKVLTDRVLRLLLPRPDGSPGTSPHKILCLTFTKAAASEMALRISSRLGRWAVMPAAGGPDDQTLGDELHRLLGRPPEKHSIEAARRLFAEVIDTPGGLQIMTIHAFCQSVLGRFPLEAGIAPGFSALDEADSAALLARARDTALQKADAQRGSPLHSALQNIAGTVNEDAFFQLLRDMEKERGQFSRLQGQSFGPEGLDGHIFSALGLAPDITPSEIILEACRDENFDQAGLENAAEWLSAGTGQQEQKAGPAIMRWHAQAQPERAENFALYAEIFLTREGDVRSRRGFPTKSLSEKHPECGDILQQEGERLKAVQDRIKAAYCARLTTDLLRLGHEILEEYQTLKERMAALDFNDLILKTLDLLQTENMAGWVQYKLDQGLEHILIDEAQDTNPEQWGIIEALCTDFFSGDSARPETRTVFTVGDEKQSIYSFQRASPKEFERMREFFREKVQQGGYQWDDVDLHVSFRSTASVLRTVDAVFADPAVRAGLGFQEIAHESYRRGQEGCVELWPLCETPPRAEIDYWQPPVEPEETTDGANDLAEKIAAWIDSAIGQETLPSRNRTLQPGDILVLVRTRTSFVEKITRALKNRDIPVSGVDRMALYDQIAVQDLLACAEFALLPSDDLSLAAILKAPLIGLSEDELMTLAIERGTLTLWQALQQSPHREVTAYLEDMATKARHAGPFAFFSDLLNAPCPADDISGLRAIRSRLGPDAADPLDELLSAAIGFEQDHVPSLQLFLHRQGAGDTEIKRELEESGGQVRIMTVHGAKGLQAPVVFLPDTVRSTTQAPGQADKRLLWPDKTGLSMPLWSPRKNFDCETYTAARTVLEERADEEYRRLLYVALTRAEDRLYVCGYTGRKTPIENSWYFQIKAGLERLEDTAEPESGHLRLTNPQTKPADRHEQENEASIITGDPPPWLFTPAPDEETPPRPLVPSRPSEPDVPAASPLQKENLFRFRRGNITHRLLQFLPDLPQEHREQAAHTFSGRFGRDLPEDLRADIVRETLAVLDHPEFAPVFGPGSMAEVPVTGLAPENRLISGQIDRLLVTDSEILIVDFKTNRQPPRDETGVPALYRQQMEAYASILRGIYPVHQILCALLWTDGPFLMKLPVE